MPGYGSLSPESLRKMNGNLEANAGRRGRGFSFGGSRHANSRDANAKQLVGHIVGDPFALATISIAYVCTAFDCVNAESMLMMGAACMAYNIHLICDCRC